LRIRLRIGLGLRENRLQRGRWSLFVKAGNTAGNTMSSSLTSPPKQEESICNKGNAKYGDMARSNNARWSLPDPFDKRKLGKKKTKKKSRPPQAPSSQGSKYETGDQ